MTIQFEQLLPWQQALMTNLFLIGASKAATTSLHRYLSAHPQVLGSREKEPSFFVANDDLRRVLLMESLRPEAQSLDAYLALYPGGEAYTYRIEASPTYASFRDFPGVPARIRAASPQATIMYLVRNPVDRSISHYWQNRKTLKEQRSIAEAFADDNIYVHTSDYAAQLDRYLPHFERVLLLATEDLRDDPHGFMQAVHAALDLPDHPLPDDFLKPRNATRPTVRNPRWGMVTSLRDTVAWNRLRAHLPRGVLKRIRHLTVTEEAKDPAQEAAVRQQLRAHFEPQVQAFDARFGTALFARWFAAEGEQPAPLGPVWVPGRAA